MTRLRADLTLLFIAVIWGAAFVAQKVANDCMGPLGFVGARFALSFIAVAPLALFEIAKRNSLPSRSDLGFAVALGLCLFVGSALQQVGLVTTTATNGGFLTALYVILVPIIVWAMNGVAPRPVVGVASILSVAGAWLLTARGYPQQLTGGDTLILIADLVWAVWISLVPIYLDRTNRPLFLAFAQFGVAAVLGVTAGLSFETVSADALTKVLPAILYAGLLSGALAFTLQIVAQKYTPPAEAALIMSLESVFAAIAGAAILSERLTGPALVGCALIMLGVFLVEAGPIAQNLQLPARPRSPL